MNYGWIYGYKGRGSSLLRALLKAEGFSANFVTLVFAAKHGNVEVVRMLLAPGARSLADGQTMCRALWCAAARGHTTIVRAILEGAPKSLIPAMLLCPDRDGTGEDQTPLAAACARGHGDVVRALLGAEVEAHSSGQMPLELVACYRGMPPLWAAAAHGHANIVRMLGEGGFGLGATAADRAYKGTTPLAVACSRGYEEAVRQLLLVLRARTGYKIVPSLEELLCASVAQPGVVRALLEAGATCPAEALEEAVALGRVSTMRLLLAAPGVSAKGAAGERLLRVAEGSYRAVAQCEVVDMLVAAGADPAALFDRTRDERSNFGRPFSAASLAKYELGLARTFYGAFRVYLRTLCAREAALDAALPDQDAVHLVLSYMGRRKFADWAEVAGDRVDPRFDLGLQFLNIGGLSAAGGCTGAARTGGADVGHQ